MMVKLLNYKQENTNADEAEMENHGGADDFEIEPVGLQQVMQVKREDMIDAKIVPAELVKMYTAQR